MRKSVFLICFLLLFFNAWGNDVVEIDNEVCRNIKKATQDITEIYIAPYELLYSESSQKVKKFFCREEKKMLSYLYCPDLKYEEKEILLWIVSKDVDLKLYEDFLVTLSERNLKEKIEDKLIQCCFFNWCLDYRVILNYKNEKIQKAVDNFLETDISRKTEKELKDLKKGKSAKRIKWERMLRKYGFIPET